MPKVAFYLVYVAVVLRGLVHLAGEPSFGVAAALLALFGLFLVLAETFLRSRASFAKLGFAKHGIAQAGFWLPVLYLLLQTGLVVGLLLVHPDLDFFGLLFVPLSMQAIFFFGWRLALLCIGFFSLAMAGPMLIGGKPWVFTLTMTVLNTGYCLLFSGYAYQVQKAESVRKHNQDLLGELQVAHRRLQGYALQAEDLAAERERGRLARELHDSVTQTMFSMNLTVQSARLLLERAPDRADGQLERLEELAAGAMGEIQALVTQLRPHSLAEEGLPTALRRLAAERQARDGLQVTLDADGERALPEAVCAGLHRIAQEALANVVKHSGTHEATVRLNLADGASFLEVEDDGLGFDPQVALGQRGHLGLAGMAERAREIGWSLSIESRSGGGTRIRVEENSPGGMA